MSLIWGDGTQAPPDALIDTARALRLGLEAAERRARELTTDAVAAAAERQARRERRMKAEARTAQTSATR